MRSMPTLTGTETGFRIKVNGRDITFRKFVEAENRLYLPNYVFGYYSGPSNRMEEHFKRHQELFYRELIDVKRTDPPLRPLFYARPVHSMFVLLAFFLEQSPQMLSFLRDQLGIVGLDSVLFIMQEPSWDWKKQQGDLRFWNLRGTVNELLDKLFELALAPLRLTRKIPIDFRRNKTFEFLYLFLKDLDAVRRLREAYPTDQAFFKALESTYISEVISEVLIRVQARKVDGSLTFRELSEGEQQLLTVLGLLRFTREDESLFLLDEPDTHLNPAWSVEYLNFLREIGGTQENSHIIMATHDPLVIAGLEKEQVQILERDDDSGQISAHQPHEDPRGMGVAGLLTSEVYGLRSQLDLETLKLLDEKRELAAKEELSDEDSIRLSELDQQLGDIDATRTVRDPLYEKFVRAMSQIEREEGMDQVVLTKEQKTRQYELALQLLRELREDT